MNKAEGHSPVKSVKSAQNDNTANEAFRKHFSAVNIPGNRGKSGLSVDIHLFAIFFDLYLRKRF